MQQPKSMDVGGGTGETEQSSDIIEFGRLPMDKDEWDADDWLYIDKDVVVAHDSIELRDDLPRNEGQPFAFALQDKEKGITKFDVAKLIRKKIRESRESYSDFAPSRFSMGNPFKGLVLCRMIRQGPHQFFVVFDKN
jgi:hypothetical protein